MPKTARRGACVVARGGKVDQSPDSIAWELLRVGVLSSRGNGHYAMLQGADCGWVYAALSNVAGDFSTVDFPATPRLRVLGLDLKLPENMTAKKAPGQPPALDRLDLCFLRHRLRIIPRRAFGSPPRSSIPFFHLGRALGYHENLLNLILHKLLPLAFRDRRFR